jgi:hypothetical protein
MTEPRLRVKKPAGPCGTYAGAAAHRARGDPLCPDCLRAHRDYQAFYRFRTGFQHDPRRCPDCGSTFPGHTCHMGAP